MQKKLFLLGAFLMNLVLAPVALAQWGLSEAADGAGIPKGTSVAARAGQLTGAALSLIGVIFFVLMLYGGFLWMTARGEPKKADTAKGIIIDAIIGLVIVGAAYIITSFVFRAVATPV